MLSTTSWTRRNYTLPSISFHPGFSHSGLFLIHACPYLISLIGTHFHALRTCTCRPFFVSVCVGVDGIHPPTILPSLSCNKCRRIQTPGIDAKLDTDVAALFFFPSLGSLWGSTSDPRGGPSIGILGSATDVIACVSFVPRAFLLSSSPGVVVGGFVLRRRPGEGIYPNSS